MTATFIVKKKAQASYKEYSMANSEYTMAVSGSGALELPLLQTDFRDVFYLANPDGSATFLQLKDNVLAQYSGEVKKVDIKVTCSNEVIPATIHYIERKGTVTGFGIYTNVISDADVKIHEFAYFKLTQMPKGLDIKGALLLIDFEKNNFVINDKIYTEAFSVNLTNGDTKRVVLEKGRTIDTKGAMREDWAMMTDYFLQSAAKEPLFLSGRNYNLDEIGMRTDIIKLNGKKKPKVLVSDMLGFWAKVTDYGIAFVRQSNDAFECFLNDNGEEHAYLKIQGHYYRDYLQDGEYVLHKDTLKFTNLLSGDEIQVSDVGFAKQPEVLSVSPDGKRAVVAGQTTQQAKGLILQKLCICNLETGTATIYEEPFLYEYSTFYWADNNTFVHARPKNDDGTGLQYVVMNIQ